MQFKVPQNIDMQDRIIGPLALGQFMYLVFGGIIIYILFSKLAPNGLMFLFILLAIPIGLFTFAMAFLKVNDRPFPMFVLAAFQFFARPRQRIWQHWAPAAPQVKPATAQPATQTAKKNFDVIRAREVAQVLDQPSDQSNNKGVTNGR